MKAVPYLKLPPETKSVSVELSYRDGSVRRSRASGAEPQIDETGSSDAGTSSGRPTRLNHAGCCIVGGGPAGMMCWGIICWGAPASIPSCWKKHADFFRDFRGDHRASLDAAR